MKQTCFFVVLLLAAMVTGAVAQDLVVYDDARQNGWESYGWATLNYSGTGAVHSGSCAISVTDSSGSGALYLHHSAFANAGYGSLTFWLYPTKYGSNQFGVQATLNGVAQTKVMLSVAGNQQYHWRQISIPLSS